LFFFILFALFCFKFLFCCCTLLQSENQMYLTRSEYDRGVNTFSPEGRLFQVEYAIEAVKLGSTAVGIQTREGVVLAIEKRLTSTLLEPSSVEKVLEIDSHVGAAFSGLIGDARTLVDHARIESQNHRFTFDEPIGVEALTQAVCDLALGFGEGRSNDDEPKMSRPFGVALLFAGWDKLQGPQLFFSDPSGTFFQFKAKAIGAGSEGAQITLQEKYREDMSLVQAEDLALEILKQVMEDKLTGTNIEVASVTAAGYHLYPAEEIQTAIGRLSSRIL
jgi:20S proteasome subunit alpha 5